jgi:hypothetical protein
MPRARGRRRVYEDDEFVERGRGAPVGADARTVRADERVVSGDDRTTVSRTGRFDRDGRETVADEERDLEREPIPERRS